MKAVITTRTSCGIEICRLACGGHGYSLASGLPQLYCSVVALATAEGEATVLLLQTARCATLTYNIRLTF
jgi:acyl-CoA oxidase